MPKKRLGFLLCMRCSRSDDVLAAAYLAKAKARGDAGELVDRVHPDVLAEGGAVLAYVGTKE